jgi:hypothetical protein
MMGHAQDLNVLNVEEMMQLLTPTRFLNNERAMRWFNVVIRREITDIKHFAQACVTLHITRKQCMTQREHRVLMTTMRMLGKTAVVMAEYSLLTPSDYATYPWLRQALDRGDNIERLSVTSSSANIVDHFVEVVIERFTDGGDVTAITLGHVMAEDLRWKKQLEREASEKEGDIELLFDLDPEYDVYLLKDKQAYVREGYLMEHCVGGYSQKAGRAILSIRRGTQSVATVELNVQIPTETLKERDMVTVNGQTFPRYLMFGDRIVIKQIRGPKNAQIDQQLEANFRAGLARFFKVEDKVDDTAEVIITDWAGALGMEIDAEILGGLRGSGRDAVFRAMYPMFAPNVGRRENQILGVAAGGISAGDVVGIAQNDIVRYRLQNNMNVDIPIMDPHGLLKIRNNT